MSPNFGGKPWSLVHHVCLKSAVERINPTDVLFYCEYEPSGPWWELSRKLVSLQNLKAPQEIFGNPVLHPAHRADIVRLEKLLSVGGIYLDADVFVHRSFNELLEFSTVLGSERVNEETVGLCNAVILAEREAPFLRRWYSEYTWFRSRGKDKYWDEHSVRVPYQLSKTFPAELTVLPHTAFFWPTFTPSDLSLIFVAAPHLETSKAYATHLWESPAWEPYLKHLTPGRVRSVHSSFHRWARPMIDLLPDNFGAPALSTRVVNTVGRFNRRLKALISA